MQYNEGVTQGQWRDSGLRVGEFYNTKAKRAILRPPSSSSTGNNEGEGRKVREFDRYDDILRPKEAPFVASPCNPLTYRRTCVEDDDGLPYWILDLRQTIKPGP